MTLHKASDIILVIFVSISIPIYVIFIVTVLRNRAKEPFTSAFFTLCISLGVADIVNEFHAYLFVKTAGWGWFKEFWLTYGSPGSFLALYSNAMLFGMAVNQHLGVFLLSFNRFTAIVFINKHETIWRSRNIKIAIAVQWIFPFLFVLPMSTSQFEYAYYVEGGVVDYDSISVNFCDNNYTTGYYLSSTFINFLVNVSTCGMYITVFVKAFEQAKRMTNITPTPTAVSISNRSSQNSVRVPQIIITGPPPDDESPRPETPPRKSTPFAAASLATQAVRQRQRRTGALMAFAVNQRTAYFQRELQLAFSGFLLFLSMLGYFTYLLLVLITGNAEFDGGLMYNIVCDIFSCINPYTVLLMSRQTRAAFKRTLQCK